MAAAPHFGTTSATTRTVTRLQLLRAAHVAVCGEAGHDVCWGAMQRSRRSWRLRLDARQCARPRRQRPAQQPEAPPAYKLVAPAPKLVPPTHQGLPPAEMLARVGKVLALPAQMLVHPAVRLLPPARVLGPPVTVLVGTPMVLIAVAQGIAGGPADVGQRAGERMVQQEPRHLRPCAAHRPPVQVSRAWGQDRGLAFLYVSS